MKLALALKKIRWVVLSGATLLGVVVLLVREPEAVADRARPSRTSRENPPAHAGERCVSGERSPLNTPTPPIVVGRSARVAQGVPTDPNSVPVQARGASLLPDVWVHEGDSDGDGLTDEFELRHGLDPRKVCTFDDAIPDEERIAPDGRTYGAIQEAEQRGEPCRHEHWANPAVSGRK